jgi:hypothetical protein
VRAFPVLTDTVEKVGAVPPARNNRIIGIGFLIELANSMLVLNQCCSEAPFKILFQQHRPEADFGITCRKNSFRPFKALI